MNTENNLSSKMQFILICCKSVIDENGIKIIRNNVTTANNLEEISILAYGHGVYPLFYHTVMEHASDLIDQEMKDAMAYLFKSIKVINETMVKELLHFIEIFEKHNIEVLSFKGPVLADIAYGDISLRQYLDLDIFCKRQDFKKISSILIADGYKAQFSIEKFDDKTLFEFNHDVPFVNEEKGIVIEVHFEFFRKELYIPTEKFKPWESVKNTDILTRKINTLSDETHLLFLAAHGSKHLWEKVEWIVDIDKMVRYSENIDWDLVTIKAKQIGILNIFLSSLILSQNYFNTPLPNEIIKMNNNKITQFNNYFDKLILNSEAAPNIATLSRIHKFTRMRDSLGLRVISFLSSILRPNKSDREIVQFSDKYFFLYWPFRFFRLITKI